VPEIVLFGRIIFITRLVTRTKEFCVETHRSYTKTRKIVNYAWAGRSHLKEWWKPVAILTCKSFVWLWYGGERLIELSSSWFPAKFS